MAKLKINHIRHTISSMKESTTVMPVDRKGIQFRRRRPRYVQRENYKLTIHGIVFSTWQNLVRFNDWEDFNNGKEGVCRYRVQNLPRKSCPGLYELGVAVIRQNQGRKLEPDDVLAAYLGQSVDVRSRLQDYGRSGGHLPHSLYKDIFLRQGSILFRWAPMGSKKEAVATKGMLLSKYDYAWNTCNNGERRHLDFLKKLGDYEFTSKRKSQVLVPFLTLMRPFG